MARRDELLAEITRAESRLVDLQGEVDATRAQVAALREQIATEPPWLPGDRHTTRDEAPLELREIEDDR